MPSQPGAAAGPGLGSPRPGRGSLSLGTSGVVFMPHLKPEPDPQGRVHLFAHADQAWCLLGVTLAAGGSIAWFRDRFLAGQDFGQLNRLAVQAPSGSAGVSFHPYLAGERRPWLDPRLRGSFTGLSLASGLPELARAVLEGVAFSLRDVLDVFREQLEVSQLLVTGGGASSELFLQIAASALEVELQVVAGGTGAAYGSALLALQGLKLTDAAASAARVSLSSRMTPQPDAQLEDMRQRGGVRIGRYRPGPGRAQSGHRVRPAHGCEQSLRVGRQLRQHTQFVQQRASQSVAGSGGVHCADPGRRHVSVEFAGHYPDPGSAETDEYESCTGFQPGPGGITVVWVRDEVKFLFAELEDVRQAGGATDVVPAGLRIGPQARPPVHVETDECTCRPRPLHSSKGG